MTNRPTREQLHAHLDSGWDSAFAGDLHRALLAAERTLDLDQSSAEAHHLLGYVRSAEGNIAEALEHFEQAISLDDGYVDALISAADLRFSALDDTDGALRHLDEALEYAQSPDEIANASVLCFEIYLRIGDEDKARATLSRIPEGPFENPALDAMLGQAFVDAGEFTRAKQVLSRCLEHEPDNPDAHYHIARAYELAGERQAADAHLLHSREIESRLASAPWSLQHAEFEREMRAVFDELPQELLQLLTGTAVIVTTLPGAEVVADGVDPRVPMMFDDLQTTGTVGRIFFYQVNIERLCVSPDQIRERTVALLSEELRNLLASLE